MPIVTIQITREGSTPDVDSATAEEKAALIRGISELLRDVLGKPLDSTFVVIEEVPLESWGWGGLPVADYRATRRLAEQVSGQPPKPPRRTAAGEPPDDQDGRPATPGWSGPPRAG